MSDENKIIEVTSDEDLKKYERRPISVEAAHHGWTIGKSRGYVNGDALDTANGSASVGSGAIVA